MLTLCRLLLCYFWDLHTHFAYRTKYINKNENKNKETKKLEQILTVRQYGTSENLFWESRSWGLCGQGRPFGKCECQLEIGIWWIFGICLNSWFDYDWVWLFHQFQKVIHAAGSEDDVDFIDTVEGLTMNDAIHPPPGGAFSALTPSMWPQDILARLTQPEVLP